MTPTERIADFQVEQLLGKGGMGAVYRVRNSAGQVLALKLLDAELDDPLDRLRFEREFRLASALSHPHLVKVHEFGTWSGQPFYTMDWVAGRNLRVYMEQERARLPWEIWLGAAARLIAEILSALAFVHGQGIVHRDLKPENILIDKDERVVLLDFGLARENNASRLTQTGTTLGTPQYMAPEQVMGSNVDARSDLFSLGTIAYEMVSGQSPHPGADFLSKIRHLLDQPAEPLQPLGPLPAGAEAWITRLLARSRDDRFPSASEALASWKVLFPSVAQGESEALPVASLPQLFYPAFCGRTELLLDLEDALGKQTGVFLVEGASGSGKSRTLQEMTRVASRCGWPTVLVRAHDSEGLAYGAWIPVLQGCMSQGLPAALEEERGTLALLFPGLGSPAELGLAGKFRLFQAMELLLKQVRRFVAVDDLQSLDAASQEFFAYLARRPAPGQLFLCASLTLEEKRPAFVRELPEPALLSPLDEASSAQLCASMLGAPLDTAALDRLYRESGGSPLFLVETLKMLDQEGRIQRNPGQPCSLTAETESRPRLPANLAEVCERRLHGLAPAEREVLETLAALGGSAEFALLSKLLPLQPAELLDRLESLRRRQLVWEAGNARYAMLAQLVSLVQARTERPTELHRGIAERLRGLPEVPQEQVAEHYRRAGLREAAAERFWAAAERHMQAYNPAQAAEFYEQVRAMNCLPEGVTEKDLLSRLADAWFGAQRTEEALEAYRQLLRDNWSLKLKLLESACLWRRGQLAELNEVLREGLARAGHPLRSGSWVQQAGTFWRMLRILAGGRSHKRRKTESDAQLQELEMLLVRTLFFLRPPGWEKDTQALVTRPLAGEGLEQKLRRRTLLGFSLLFLREFARARPHVETAADLVWEMPDSHFKSQALVDLTYLVWASGSPRAREFAERSYAHNVRRGDLSSIIQGGGVLARIHRLAGRLQESERYGREARSAILELRRPWEMCFYLFHLAILRSLRRDPTGGAEALEQVDETVAQLGYLGDEFRLAQAYVRLSAEDRKGTVQLTDDGKALVGLEQVHTAERRLLTACAHLEGPIDVAEKSLSHLEATAATYPWLQASALPLRARLFERRGETERARSLLEDGLALCAQHDLPLYEAHAAVKLHRLGGADALRARAAGALERGGAGEELSRRVLEEGRLWEIAGP